MVENSEIFKKQINKMDDAELEEIMFIISAVIKDFSVLINAIHHLKKLYHSSLSLNKKLNVVDAFDSISEIIINLLNCDRGYAFLMDDSASELWSKISKGSVMIRLPISKGISGSVAKTGKNENIEDAYEDIRFDKDYDIKNNYNTKTILCVPIKDNSGQIIGICQALNKNTGVFSPDDEQILMLLSKKASYILRNCISNEHNVPFLLKLRQLLDV